MHKAEMKQAFIIANTYTLTLGSLHLKYVLSRFSDIYLFSEVEYLNFPPTLNPTNEYPESLG